CQSRKGTVHSIEFFSNYAELSIIALRMSRIVPDPGQLLEKSALGLLVVFNFRRYLLDENRKRVRTEGVVRRSETEQVERSAFRIVELFQARYFMYNTARSSSGCFYLNRRSLPLKIVSCSQGSLPAFDYVVCNRTHPPQHEPQLAE